MKIYNVGKDELCDYDFSYIKDHSKYEWIVYWYETGCYDGSGEAAAFCKEDGLLHCNNLSHCSCNGPMDCWETGCSKMTVEEFLREKDSIWDHDCKEAVKEKVKSLVN